MTNPANFEKMCIGEGSSKFDWWGLESIHGGRIGGLKWCSSNLGKIL